VPAKLKHAVLLVTQGGKVSVKAILDTGAERSLGNERYARPWYCAARDPQQGVRRRSSGDAAVGAGTSFVALRSRRRCALTNLT